MVNGLALLALRLQTTLSTLQHITFTHVHTDGRGARCKLLIWSNLEVSILLKDTEHLAGGSGDSNQRPPNYWLDLLSYILPTLVILKGCNMKGTLIQQILFAIIPDNSTL